ncbi:RNA-directed DNA polymerase [Acidovorax sp. SUPP2539]|uniref:RNA-directed DNA polymerase n=1 Tax=Acidovorax sp. SUPP2539 TaxID=2920878 RepID=UPI0023DE2060|nr:RNA-directed DNA polymerase [Acidovorax sp. SUPP2539]GKS92766.1 RNA-directed DNA polymerase [Acidovorax sp. SUPP2539]
MDPGYSFEKLVQAYYDCRRHKRTTASALRFEQGLEHNLLALHEELESGSYRPGPSICFAISRPRPREVWASGFRDRVVHHLLYNQIMDRFHARFIADSCACIPGRGTLYAAERLEAKVRGQTQNWSRPGFYLKADLANFFVSIDKRVLWPLLMRHIPERWWRGLTKMVLFHDPRLDYELRGDAATLAAVPSHKRLTNASRYHGLPIGNLSSQFFANVLLNELDQHIKHRIGARHYTRYVDDMVLLHESAEWLNGALASINGFLPGLGLALNPRKTVLQPIHRGIDYVGHVIKPWRRVTRPRTLQSALARLEDMPAADVYASGNSYLGLARQASHSHHAQALLCRALLKRGHAIEGKHLTKAFRKAP